MLTAGRCTAHGPCCWNGRPIIKCGNSGCTGSCPLSVVEYGHKAGRKPATCRTCGKTFPRPNVSGIKSRNASPTRSQKSSVSSWSVVETVLPAAVGPCAPSEPVPFSSGFVVTSEHAVISGWSAGSFAPVQGISRVDCAVTHGFGGVEEGKQQSKCLSCHVSTQSKHHTCHVSTVKCGFLERLTARSSSTKKCGGSHGGLHGISSDLERNAG